MAQASNLHHIIMVVIATIIKLVIVTFWYILLEEWLFPDIQGIILVHLAAISELVAVSEGWESLTAGVVVAVIDM